MGSKNIEESQEQSEGKAISSTGRDMGVTAGQKGTHHPKNHPADLRIPNQEASSAAKQRKADGAREEAE